MYVVLIERLRQRWNDIHHCTFTASRYYFARDHIFLLTPEQFGYDAFNSFIENFHGSSASPSADDMERLKFATKYIRGEIVAALVLNFSTPMTNVKDVTVSSSFFSFFLSEISFLFLFFYSDRPGGRWRPAS